MGDVASAMAANVQTAAATQPAPSPPAARPPRPAPQRQPRRPHPAEPSPLAYGASAGSGLPAAAMMGNPFLTEHARPHVSLPGARAPPPPPVSGQAFGAFGDELPSPPLAALARERGNSDGSSAPSVGGPLDLDHAIDFLLAEGGGGGGGGGAGSRRGSAAGNSPLASAAAAAAGGVDGWDSLTPLGEEGDLDSMFTNRAAAARAPAPAPEAAEDFAPEAKASGRKRERRDGPPDLDPGGPGTQAI